MTLSPLDPALLRPGHWQPVLGHLFGRYEKMGQEQRQALIASVGKS